QRPAAQMLCAAAATHVEAMRGASGLQSGVREAAGVTRGARSFQAMNHDQMSGGLARGRLRMNEDLHAGLGIEKPRLNRERPLIEVAAPIVTGDRREVRVSKVRDEGLQTIILRWRADAGSDWAKKRGAGQGKPRPSNHG